MIPQKAIFQRVKKTYGEVSRTIPFFSPLGSQLIDSHVTVETWAGTVEGTLKHIDCTLSHDGHTKYPKCLILQNENGFIIIRHWQTVKRRVANSLG